MSESAFLDTGVVFGYCVPLDKHHFRCEEYIEDRSGDLYTCSEVEKEYQQVMKKRIQDLSTAVLEHVQSLLKADLDESLGPMDLDHIKKRVLSRNNDAYQFLYRYYDDELSNFVQRDKLISDLRGLARDIETVSLKRKQQLDTIIEEWQMEGSHQDIRSSLSMIHQEDLTICLHAHDISTHRSGSLEFATTNPQDFIDDGREDIILEVTAIDSIRNLAIR